MPKVLTIAGMIVAVLLLLTFGLDAAFGILGHASMMLDILFLICALLLGYMSWSTFRGLA